MTFFKKLGFVSTLLAVVAVCAVVFAVSASACPQAAVVYQQQAAFAPAECECYHTQAAVVAQPQYFVQPQAAVVVQRQVYAPPAAVFAPSYSYGYSAGASFAAGYGGGGFAYRGPNVAVDVGGRRGLFDRIHDRRTARQVGRATRASAKAVARGVVPLQAVPIY